MRCNRTIKWIYSMVECVSLPNRPDQKSSNAFLECLLSRKAHLFSPIERFEPDTTVHRKSLGQYSIQISKFKTRNVKCQTFIRMVIESRVCYCFASASQKYFQINSIRLPFMWSRTNLFGQVISLRAAVHAMLWFLIRTTPAEHYQIILLFLFVSFCAFNCIMAAWQLQIKWAEIDQLSINSQIKHIW